MSFAQGLKCNGSLDAFHYHIGIGGSRIIGGWELGFGWMNRSGREIAFIVNIKSLRLGICVGHCFLILQRRDWTFVRLDLEEGCRVLAFANEFKGDTVEVYVDGIYKGRWVLVTEPSTGITDFAKIFCSDKLFMQIRLHLGDEVLCFVIPRWFRMVELYRHCREGHCYWRARYYTNYVYLAI